MHRYRGHAPSHILISVDQIELILALALALRRGLIADLILEAERGQECGRGLAPDSSVSANTCVTEPPSSGASPLPHLDLHGSDRTRSAFVLALVFDLDLRLAEH